MDQYLDLLHKILKQGVDRAGRNGDTRALFAQQLRFNLNDGFPAVTTKKLAFRTMASELLWFLEGSGDDNRLQDIAGTNRTIWSDNATAPYWKRGMFPGDLGRIYGVQWRKWRAPILVPRHVEGLQQVPDTWYTTEVDQISELIKGLRSDPFGRRHVVTAWNPGEIKDMALPPCHMIFQLFAYPNGQLSLHMVQRSCDMFLGVPFNIASYALLLSMVAQVVGMRPYECILTLNDAHIYHAHINAVKEQLCRNPFPLPQLWLNPAVREIDAFKMEDIELRNYQSHPTIKAEMIV